MEGVDERGDGGPRGGGGWQQRRSAGSAADEVCCVYYVEGSVVVKYNKRASRVGYLDFSYLEKLYELGSVMDRPGTLGIFHTDLCSAKIPCCD